MLTRLHDIDAVGKRHEQEPASTWSIGKFLRQLPNHSIFPSADTV
jgi:hypothetical protein